MADRTWNAIFRDILERDWSEWAIDVARDLLTRCPNAEGLFGVPLGGMRRFYRGMFRGFGVKGEVVDAALDAALTELVEVGFIRRSGDHVWIIKKWRRATYNNYMGNNQIGALRFCQQHFPEFHEEFAAMYPVGGDWAKQTEENQRAARRFYSDEEPEPRPKPKPKPKSDPPKRSQAEPVDLAALEATVPEEWRDAWTAWKGGWIDETAGGKRADRVIASALTSFIEFQQKERITNAQMVYGLNAAIQRPAYNVNYAKEAARRHDPDTAQAAREKDRWI